MQSRHWSSDPRRQLIGSNMNLRAALAPVTILCLSFSVWPAIGQVNTLESGVAITDPAILGPLEAERYSIGALLFPPSASASSFPKNPAARSMKNDNLFKGALQSVATTLIADIDSLPQASRDPSARDVFQEPDSKRLRFSSSLLNDPKSGFVLTGIVNRMDRALATAVDPQKLLSCGEIRFIYRFTYDVRVEGGQEVTSRLPLTASVVLNAKNKDDAVTCADIASRWQEAGRKASSAELLAYLQSDQGPLVTYLKPSQVDRLEVNIQLFRLPASLKPRFGGYAEYLLRVFRRDALGQPFLAARMENQIDRDRVVNDGNLNTSFRTWLLSASTISDLDRGLLSMPSQYLAVRAVSVSPGGFSRSQNQPLFGLVADQDIENALQSYEASGQKLQSIKSAAAFRKRINDLSCTGCHQTRAIAGFHFPGADPAGEHASNAVHVPGSPHFFGDLPRRRAVIDAFAAQTTPDFSRGYSDRPDEKFRAAFSGTQLFDGWGAACYVGHDASFSSWTCASGLKCKVLHNSPQNLGMGTCIDANAVKIGDPVEFGNITHHAFGDDSYLRSEPPGSTDPGNYVVPEPPHDRTDYVVSHQGFREADTTGGFPGGMLRISGCNHLPGEATCGRVAATGFNDCIAQGKPFPVCLTFTRTAGLRACNKANPCRDDYICTAPYEDLADARKMGTCIPPYFMFQFRVDGHPSSFSGQPLTTPPAAPSPQ